MVLKGKTALSDAELIAILIGSGSRNESAVSLSQRILAAADNSLNGLSKLTVPELQKFKGIGHAKAISIVAALELGHRRRAETASEVKKINSSNDAFKIMQPIIGDLAHEEFWILYLDNRKKVVQKLQLSKGGITGTVVDVRLVFRFALQTGALGIILAHNHPSGTPKPSKNDKDLTKKLKNAGEGLDIKVLDHVIITEKAYFSFADENLL